MLIMSTNTKQKTSFKDRVNATVGKLKAYGQGYKSDLQTAYNVGYTAGLQDGANIPVRVGSRNMAVIGYSKGIGKYRRLNKRNKRNK